MARREQKTLGVNFQFLGKTNENSTFLQLHPHIAEFKALLQSSHSRPSFAFPSPLSLATLQLAVHQVQVPHATSSYLKPYIVHRRLKRGAGRKRRRHCAFLHVGGFLLSSNKEQPAASSQHPSSTFSQPLSHLHTLAFIQRTCIPLPFHLGHVVIEGQQHSHLSVPLLNLVRHTGRVF